MQTAIFHQLRLHLLPVLTLVFFAAGPARANKADYKKLEDITYAEYERENLKLDLYLPNQNTDAITALPLIIYINGGGFRSGNKSEVQESPFLESSLLELTHKGHAAVASIEHRRAGRRNPIENLIADVGAAIQWANLNPDKHPIDASKIILTGNGSGGYLALIAGLKYQNEAIGPIKGIVAIGPLLDFVTVAEELEKNPQDGDNQKNLRRIKIAFDGNTLQDDSSRYQQASPFYQLTEHAPPMLLIYSEADPLHRQLQYFSKAAQEKGVTLESNILKDTPEDFISDEETRAQVLSEQLQALSSHVYQYILDQLQQPPGRH